MGPTIQHSKVGIPRPDYLYGTGRDMLHAAQALQERNESRNETRFTATIYFLMGFIVEFFLKFFLSRHKATEIALKKIGHDLRLALSKAEQAGFAFSEIESLRVLVNALAEAHIKFSFRYMEPDTTINVPEPISACLALLDRLDDFLRQFVNIAAAKAALR